MPASRRCTGTRNDPIRAVVLQRLNGTPAYRRLFGTLFPSVAAGGPIDFSMFARAIAEFEITLVFADAPVDRFARGDRHAMSEQQKRGALIFFGKGRCSECRYKFRSSPLRNVALQAAFFHNGAMTRLENAIRHHLDVFDSRRRYDARKAGIDKHLRYRVGPIEPVLARVDPILQRPIPLTGGEFEALVGFVRDGLLDPRAASRGIPARAPIELARAS